MTSRFFAKNWHRRDAGVTVFEMQPIHIDDLLGGTWQWDFDDEDHAEELEHLHTMLDELVLVLDA